MPKAKKKAPKVKKAVKAKKKAVKKTVKKAKTVKKPVRSPDAMIKIGEVTHYFPHEKAAAIKILKNTLKVGDQVYIKGHTTDFKEKVSSIQLEHITINEAKKGQEIGLLVKYRVRIGDSVYRI